MSASLQLSNQIKQTSPEAQREFENDLKTWESALEGYRELMSYESSIRRLKEVDISSLETQIHAQDELLPSLAETAEKVKHQSSSKLIRLTCML